MSSDHDKLCIDIIPKFSRKGMPDDGLLLKNNTCKKPLLHYKKSFLN